MKSLGRFPATVKSGSVSVRVYRLKRPARGKRPARTVFSVSWTVAGQRRLAQFADAKRAFEEARLKADQLAGGRTGAAEMSADDAATLAAATNLCGQTPIMAALQEWKRARELCDGSIIPACQAWADQNKARLETVTVAEAVKRFLDAKTRAGVDIDASYNRCFPKLLEAFGQQPIATISSRAIQAWLDTIAHPVSRNTYRKRAVALWRWCRKRAMLPQAVQTEAERTDRAQEASLEIGLVGIVEFAKALELVRTKHPDHLGVVVLAGFCGLRRSELHSQRWADVNLERGFVRVTGAKKNTPSKRLVPLAPAAIQWLMLCDRSADLVSPAWGMDAVRGFCREAKIACPENGFRHAYISNRIAQTGNVAETALEAGNSPAIIHRHYRELVAKPDGETWFGLTPTSAREIGKVVPIPKGAIAV